MRDTILCLCDLTGVMAEPWVADGYRAILIDPQHPKGVHREGLVTRVGHIIDHPEAWRIIRENLHRAAFVAGFPPCTDLTKAGARWFKDKADADPAFQFKAMQVVWQCHNIGEMSGAPYFLENPSGRISTLWRKPDHSFHPWQFTALEPGDRYTKLTDLWVGNGFTMPRPSILPEVEQAIDFVVRQCGRMVSKKKAIEALPGDDFIARWYPDNRIHYASPGKDRANKRSATPQGFARAVFASNEPAGSRKSAA